MSNAQHTGDFWALQCAAEQKEVARLKEINAELLEAAVAFMEGEGNCKEVRQMFRAAIAKAKAGGAA